MADKVQISTIRVSAEVDASKYKQGADQIAAGNRQMAASSKELAATVTQTQQKVSQSGDVFERLARKFIDGHAASMQFKSALSQLATGVERGNITMQQTGPLLEGMYKSFGRLGDATIFTARGQTELAAAVERANAELRSQQQILSDNTASEQAKRIDELRMRFDSAYASSQRLSAELRDLAEAEKIGALSAAQAATQLDVLVRKYDEVAAAKHRAQQEHATFTADQNQQRFTQSQGITEAPRPGSVAGGSAAVFEAEFARIDDIARQKAAQAGATFASELAESLRANISGKVAAQSAAVFQAEFDRIDEIARQQALQTGAAFGQWLGDSLRSNLSGKVASQSAAVFQAEFDRLDEIARQQAVQTGQAFAEDLANSMRTNLSGKIASQSASVFQAEFDRLDEIARLKAQQIGQNFQASLNASFGIGATPNSARASAGIFEEAARETEMFARQADELKAALDPAAAAVDRMNAEIAQYNVLLGKGLITQEQFNHAQEMSAQRHIGSQAGQGGQARFGAINAAAQLQDIAVTSAMGQDIMTIALQQGSQLGPALENLVVKGSGVKGMITGLGTAFMSLVTPVNLFAIGFTAVIALAVQFAAKLLPTTKTLKEAVDEHRAAVEKLGEAYGTAAIKAEDFGKRSIVAERARVSTETKTLGEAVAKSGRDVIDRFTQVIPRSGGVMVKTAFSDFQAPIRELMRGIKADNPDYEKFVLNTEALVVAGKGTRGIADFLQGFVADVAAANQQLEKTQEMLSQMRQFRMPEHGNLGTLPVLQLQQQAIVNRMQQQAAVDRMALTARSPTELAAVARAREEAKAPGANESGAEQGARKRLAYTQALIEAEQALKDAQEDRDRSQQRSLVTAQQNLDMVGKTVAETEGLRLANQRQAEIEDAAERNHIKADAAAIARARARAMEEGKIIAQQQARQDIVGQEKQLATLQKETQLVGTNALAHDAAMRVFENEQRIKELGIKIDEAAAAQMRINIALINQEIAARARAQFMIDLEFAHLQRGRSATEQAIRTRLRSAGFDEEADSPARRAAARDVAEERQLEIAAEDRARQAAIKSATQEIDLVGKTTTEVAALRYEYERIAALEEEAIRRNEKVDPARVAAAHAEALQVGINAARQSAAESIQSQKEAIELQKAEVSLIGQGTLAREAAIATLKTEIEIRKLGTGVTEAQTKAMRENTAELNALAEASAKAQLSADLAFKQRQYGRSDAEQGVANELRARGFDDSNLNSAEAMQIRQMEAIDKMRETWQGLFDTVNDGIDTMVDNLFDGTDSWEESLKKIGRQFARQMFDLAITNPLKNFLTGGNFNTIADMGIFGSGASSGKQSNFGGLLGSLTGASKAVASMQVQAATVFVNGSVVPGIGGAGGLFPPAPPGPSNATVPGPNSAASAQKLLESLGGTGGGGGGGAGVDTITTGAIGGVKSAGVSAGGVPLSSFFVDGKKITVATKYVGRFQGLFSDLKARGYPINTVGEGGYSYRGVGGQSVLTHPSQHSVGEAVDINPEVNKQGFGELGNWRQKGVNPYEVARAHNLEYGGGWNKPDTMHFQVPRHGSLRGAMPGDTGASEAAASVSELGNASKMAAESLSKAGLAGFETVKGLTDAAGGLTKFGSALSSFMMPGGGSGSGWFQGLIGGVGKMFGGGAAGAVNYMQSISPAATSSIIGAGGGFTGLYHEGGFAGSPASYRIGVDPRVFIGARRYHNGGLAGDEVPAILRRGEPVFKSMDHARQMSGANQNMDVMMRAVMSRLKSNVKVVNLFDPSVVGDYLKTDEGEEVYVNTQRRTGTGRGL